MVPQTRTLPKSRSRSARLAKAIELERASVGMYTMLYRIERPSHAPKAVCEAVTHLITPPIASNPARKRSVLK